MKYTQLTSLSSQELSQKLLQQQEQMRKLRFAHAINPLEKPMLLRQTRRNIARIKTIQNETTSTAQATKQ